ncbi:imelysin family protein [Paraglaciecola marina]|uniref:imelysin family protein n=1 Tax=Paraglaciecola marina TaxID=2500157 RepID=UPI00105D51BE|nr:imelysin family protein [Paraglaciecola marina]
MINLKSGLKAPHVLIAFGLTTLLSACGGGGSSGNSTTPTTPTTETTDLPTEFGEYLTDLTDGHIIPAYEDMYSEALALKSAGDTFCGLTAPSSSDLSDYQQTWSAFNSAWQSIQWLKVGAVVEDSRLFRIQLWPDENDAVSRGVESLLLEQITVTADDVSGVNVGGQGIPALEYLLFPEDSSDSLINASDKAKRCEVSLAIAQNLLNISEEILTDWQASGGDYRSQLIEGTGDFSSVVDSVEELTTNWLEHIEIVEDSKLFEILGEESPGNYENAEHVLTDESLLSIATNIETFLSIYTNDDGKGFDSILIDFLEQQTISDEITTSLTSVATQITQINLDFDSYETALADSQGREAITNLVDEMRILIDLIDVSFTQALDLNLGFNSSDGD